MIARRLTITLTATALLSGVVYSAWSQEKTKAQAAPSGQADSKKPKTLNIRFASSDHDAANDTTDFTNAVITDLDEGTIFRADLMKVDNKKAAQTADATGNLTVTDKQADVTGEKALIHYAKSKRLAVLTGNVVIKVKPKSEQKDPTAQVEPMPVSFQNGKPKVEEHESGDSETSAADTRKYPSTITCDKLEYEYGKDKKHAVLTGNFKVVQKLQDHTRTLWAEHAEWFGLEDRVLLHAPVRWEDTKNNQKGQSSNDVTVFTKEGDERIQMKSGEVTLDAPEEDEGTGGDTKSGEKPPSTKPDAKPDAKPANPPKPGPDRKALH